MPQHQRYVSNELTHFVGRGHTTGEQRYQLFLQIVRSGVLKSPGQSDVSVEPGPNGPVTKIKYTRSVLANKTLSSNDKYQASVVCFADIPLEDLSLHIQKYSAFGLSFLKTFLVDHGANPVFYVVRRSTTNVINMAAINAPNSHEIAAAHAARGGTGLSHNYSRAELFDAAEAAQQHVFPTYNTYDGRTASSSRVPIIQPPIARADREVLGNFLGGYLFPFMKFFDLGLSDEHPDNYYMEREWRIFGVLSFAIADIERILIPRAFARRLRADLPDYCGQITFAE